jgi:hypothetical protein
LQVVLQVVPVPPEQLKGRALAGVEGLPVQFDEPEPANKFVWLNHVLAIPALSV